MAAPAQPQTGAVFGRYVLVEPIGAGAMGEVWVAVDPDLDRKIALKLLRRTRSNRDDNPRLLREAQAMARLNHPNVAVVHDVGEVEGRVFIAMEFVAGESLAEFIARGPHPWPIVLPILQQAGAGLAAAHAAGIVHRDLKPANVLLGSEGRVRVLDFGLASASQSPSHDRWTPVGMLEPTTTPLPPDRKEAAVGTPAYMAPEQHRGESFDARSDQFAFCVTAFESLYGRRPFAGEHRYAVALAIVENRLDDVPPEQQAPAWIHRTILRGLSRDPEARFPDMLALLDALARDPALRRRRWLFAGSTFAVVAAAFGAWWMRPPPPDPCADAGSAMVETWSDEHRAGLAHWLTQGPAEPWREQASQRLLEGLDARALDWIAGHRSVCTDRVAQRATDRLVVARELCLAQQQQAIDMLVGLADDRSPTSAEIREPILAHPYALLRAIGRPESCTEHVPLGDVAPEPEQALALARANVWLAIELPERAQHELAGFACEPGPSCAPELALAHARALAQREGSNATAEALLEQVANRSVHTDPDLAVRAWLELARLGTQAAAIDWAGYAEALADDRLARATRIEVALLGAQFDLAAERAEAARERLDAALELAKQDPPLDADLESQLLQMRAQANRASGRLEAARADEIEARNQLELALGIGHPALERHATIAP